MDKTSIRRSSGDLEWQKTKEVVRERDKSCRLCKILTASELLALKKGAGPLINMLDCAHYLEVSARPDLVYKSYNIVLLNRYSHSNLDNYKNPITGAPITKKEHDVWWDRILRGDKIQYKYLQSKDLLSESF